PDGPLWRVAGEFAQFDLGQSDIRFLDGRQQRIHFVACRLKYSRWPSVVITTSTPCTSYSQVARMCNSLQTERNCPLNSALPVDFTLTGRCCCAASRVAKVHSHRNATAARAPIVRRRHIASRPCP